MRLTIIYDNEVYKKGIDLKSDWGFSCLIETKDETVLFDTGAIGDILLSNMKRLSVDPRNISKIAISHEHRDHNGGLKTLGPLVGDVELYRLAKKNPCEKMHLISAEETQKITEGIYTTGRIKGLQDEQSLVLKGEKGWYVLVGCSHPGVEKILDVAKQYGRVVGLVGGLHDFNNFSILERLGFICICHCTRYKKKIQMLFPRTCVVGGVGRTIKI